jgi:hypothetical protein
MTIRVTPMTPPPAAPARTTPATSWPLSHLVKKIIHKRADGAAHASPPAQRPFDRVPATIDGIDRYAPGAPVWAYIGGAWLTATVADTTGSSALVTYPAPGSADTMVETVHITHLQLRDRPARDNQRRDAAPASGAPDSAHVPDAGQARATLLVHHADEHGMCKGCADLAHFCWAPCPAARDAMRILDANPAKQGGAR